MDLQAATLLLSPFPLALLGLCIGSFLNVVIHRLPLMLERGWRRESAELLGVKVDEPEPISLASPGSRCTHCAQRIAWYENLPVLSYVLLRGRCSACKTPISPRYPVVEILTAALFALIGWRFGPHPVALLWCTFAAVLVTLAGIDWDTTLLPDSITMPLLWGGLVASALGWTIPLTDALWGAVVGYRHCGASTGSSSSPPARKGWASATSSCSLPPAPGSASRCCCRSSWLHR